MSIVSKVHSYVLSSSTRERTASKRTYLLSKVLQSTDIECLSDPVPQSRVMPGSSLTLFFIETGDRGGAGGTHPHLQTVKKEGRNPTLNNAHQVGGVCGGERVNQSCAVGCFSGVAMKKKYSFPQVVESIQHRFHE